MNLGQSVIQDLLEMADTSARPIVVYAGRFQPFHTGHFQAYQWLCKKFGADNVFIGTSNVTDNKKSPFDFNEKSNLIHRLFNVPLARIIEVKNPYKPDEILHKYDSSEIAYIAAVSQKDSGRLLHGKFFKLYKDGQLLQPVSNDIGYVIEYPMSPFKFRGKYINASTVRQMLGDQTKTSAEILKIFKELYPLKFDQTAMLVMISKLQKFSKMHESKGKMSSISIENLFAEVLRFDSKQILTCGGAAGHMLHPYEDKTLTFGGLSKLINDALAGKLEIAQEKLDGMNLLVSWKNNELIAARNKGQLKNAGQQAMDIEQIKTQFAGRGAIADAFIEAMADLKAAFKNIDPNILQQLFKEGHSFLNLEIIYPATTNVIPYGSTIINFHHFKEFDADGNEINQDHDGIQLLDRSLKAVQANNQKTYQLKILNPAVVKTAADYESQRSKFQQRLSEIMNSVGLSYSNTIEDYIKIGWLKLIEKKLADCKVPTSAHSSISQQLIQRWVSEDKSVKLSTVVNIANNTTFAQWVTATDAQSAEIFKKIINPLNTLITQLGVRVLQNVHNLTVINPDDSLKQMRKGLRDTISQIKSLNDPKDLAKLKAQLKRLHDAGGIKTILPVEGIVFKFNNNLYKLTGSFAPLNMIMGILRFKQ